MNTYFDDYKTALAHAKQQATKFSATVSVSKSGNRWCVDVPDVVGAAVQREVMPVDKSPPRLISQAPATASGARKSVKGPASRREQVAKTNKPHRKPNPAPIATAAKPASSTVHKAGKSSALLVRPEHLLAVKVFYLGQGISASPQKSVAIEMITKELSSSVMCDRGVLREVFFRLLLAEIYRGSADALEQRSMAKEIDEELGRGILFDAYMKVTEATQTAATTDKFTGKGIVSGKVESHRSEFKKVGFGQWASWTVDNALAALRISPTDLTRTQIDFLHRTTLKELIDSEDLLPD